MEIAVSVSVGMYGDRAGLRGHCVELIQHDNGAVSTNSHIHVVSRVAWQSSGPGLWKQLVQLRATKAAVDSANLSEKCMGSRIQSSFK